MVGTLKGSIFGVKPSISALRGPAGGLVGAAEKASLLGFQFEQFITHFSLVSISIGAILRLLLDHDIYGGVDSLGVFPLFLNMVADIISPKISIIFRGPIRRGLFPVCWRYANVTAIPKGAPSPDRENYRPISITAILSKVHEKLISHRLSI